MSNLLQITQRNSFRIKPLCPPGGGVNPLGRNGPEALPSARAICYGYCEHVRESLRGASCGVSRDLVFGWEIGISPKLKGIIQEEEREAYFDLIRGPCRYCPRQTPHITLRPDAGSSRLLGQQEQALSGGVGG